MMTTKKPSEKFLRAENGDDIMKRKNLLTAGLCLIIAGIMMITGAAVVSYKFTSASGEKYSNTLNRINLSVSATEFTFREADKNGMLECRTTVSIEKTEPDFYGKLDSITLSGADFGYVIYTAGKSNGEALLPENVMMPTDENGVYPLIWEIAFTVPYEEGKNTYNISVDFNYTTGVKTNLTQQYLTSIPVTIIVEE